MDLDSPVGGDRRAHAAVHAGSIGLIVYRSRRLGDIGEWLRARHAAATPQVAALIVYDVRPKCQPRRAQ